MIKYKLLVKNKCGCVKDLYSGEVTSTGSVKVNLPKLPAGGIIDIEWETIDGDNSID